MKYLKEKNNWFTLIEVLVSITIFSIIMVSVLMIFSSVTWVSARTDQSRAMQENIKNIIETISKDMADLWIFWVSIQKWLNDCNFDYREGKYRFWDKLCLGDSSVWYEYFLAKLLVDGTYNRVEESELDSKCGNLNETGDPLYDYENEYVCVFVRYNKSTWITTKLSNSLVNFKNISFYISKENIPKVTINFTIQAAIKKWVQTDLIKNIQIIFETTLSERLINAK